MLTIRIQFKAYEMTGLSLRFHIARHMEFVCGLSSGEAGSS